MRNRDRPHIVTCLHCLDYRRTCFCGLAPMAPFCVCVCVWVTFCAWNYRNYAAQQSNQSWHLAGKATLSDSAQQLQKKGALELDRFCSVANSERKHTQTCAINTFVCGCDYVANAVHMQTHPPTCTRAHPRDHRRSVVVDDDAFA